MNTQQRATIPTPVQSRCFEKLLLKTAGRLWALQAHTSLLSSCCQGAHIHTASLSCPHQLARLWHHRPPLHRDSKISLRDSHMRKRRAWQTCLYSPASDSQWASPRDRKSNHLNQEVSTNSVSSTYLLGNYEQFICTLGLAPNQYNNCRAIPASQCCHVIK